MATAAFLSKYFDCVDSMPLDLQRYVSRLRQIELEKKELFMETQRIKEELAKAIENGSKKQRLLFRQLQECLLLVREVGNTKLEISAQMLDKVEEYSQQLGLCSKDLEMNPHSDDVLLTPRGAGGPLHFHAHTANESPMGNGISESKSSVKRSSSSKRPRQPNSTSISEKDEDASMAFVANGGAGGGGRETGGGSSKAKEGVSVGVAGGGAGTGSVSSTTTGNGKPPKKKMKTMKKKVGGGKDKDNSTSAPAHMPMPDLTSQPLDPNEPTYCLCQQVSFGEMIGCDNEDCQIEWFHFQCVGLTSKPKGKWYCPSCLQERKSKSGK